MNRKLLSCRAFEKRAPLLWLASGSAAGRSTIATESTIRKNVPTTPRLVSLASRHSDDKSVALLIKYTEDPLFQRMFRSSCDAPRLQSDTNRHVRMKTTHATQIALFVWRRELFNTEEERRVWRQKSKSCTLKLARYFPTFAEIVLFIDK